MLGRLTSLSCSQLSVKEAIFSGMVSSGNIKNGEGDGCGGPGLLRALRKNEGGLPEGCEEGQAGAPNLSWDSEGSHPEDPLRTVTFTPSGTEIQRDACSREMTSVHLP